MPMPLASSTGPLVLQQLGEAVLPASQRLLTTTKGQWPWARQHAAMGSRGASLQGGEKAHLDPEAHSWRLSNMSSAQGPNLAGSQCPCWGAEKQTESVELVCLHFAIKSTCTLLTRRIEGEALSLSRPELRVRGSTGGYRSKQTEYLCLCLGSSEKMVPARQKTQAPLPCLISLCPLGAAPSVPRAAVAPALMVEPQPSVSQRSLKNDSGGSWLPSQYKAVRCEQLLPFQMGMACFAPNLCLIHQSKISTRRVQSIYLSFPSL